MHISKFPQKQKTLLAILGSYPNVHQFTRTAFVMILQQYAVAWKSKYVLSFETSNTTPVWVTREVLASIPLSIHKPKYSRLQHKPRSFKRKMQKNHIFHGYNTTVMSTIMTFSLWFWAGVFKSYFLETQQRWKDAI